MAIENVQQLLTEQLGKNRCDVILTDNMTSKDYYAIHFPIESVILSMAAGTTIFLNITAITLTSGVGLCYYEQVI